MNIPRTEELEQDELRKRSMFRDKEKQQEFKTTTKYLRGALDAFTSSLSRRK